MPPSIEIEVTEKRETPGPGARPETAAATPAESAAVEEAPDEALER